MKGIPKVHQPAKRRRGVTLIEAVLYISIALALIVGGLVFFQQASTAQRTNTMVRQLSAVLAETRVLIKGQPLQSVLNWSFFATNQTNITAKAYPVDAGVATSCGALPLGGTPVFRCWDM